MEIKPIKTRDFLKKSQITFRDLAKKMGKNLSIVHAQCPQYLHEITAEMRVAIEALGGVLPDNQPIPETIHHNQLKKDNTMLYRYTKLTQNACAKFSLTPKAFVVDVNSKAEIFKRKGNGYYVVSETMYQTAKNGGITAVVGESGSGKTTMKREMFERISEAGERIVIIEPYIVGMEENDSAGKTLKARHIAEAILGKAAPSQRPKLSNQALNEQVHKALLEGSKAGNSYCLVIEEAHCLNTQTLKHLKRFVEFQHGFKKLLSVILIGQTELKAKLDETRPEVREVVNRCEIVEIKPFNSDEIEAFINFKLNLVGKKIGDVFEKDVAARIAEHLCKKQSMGSKQKPVELNFAYPLNIQNLCGILCNKASEEGIFAKKVTVDIVDELEGK